MSLTHTRELNGANPFDCLSELQKHAEEVTENPSAWMSWNCPRGIRTGLRLRCITGNLAGPGYEFAEGGSLCRATKGDLTDGEPASWQRR